MASIADNIPTRHVIPTAIIKSVNNDLKILFFMDMRASFIFSVSVNSLEFEAKISQIIYNARQYGSMNCKSSTNEGWQSIKKWIKPTILLQNFWLGPRRRFHYWNHLLHLSKNC
jgi:hypothetical protein